MNQVLRLCSVAALAALSLRASPQLGAPRAQAVPSTERIRLDGRLDEPVWQLAPPIGPLVQIEPRQGDAPSEETEVRVVYDDDGIYFGIACRDRTPSAIVSTRLLRDSELEVDDHVVVVLDPFFGRRSGFFFEVNPAGARSDGQIASNDEHRSYDWDGIWNAAARIGAEGWVAEIAIPYKSLRFKPGQTSWGLNLERYIKRRQERDRWAGARRDVWITNLAEAGRLEGFAPPRQGRGLDVRPFVSAGRQNGDGELDPGLDVSKNLTPNLNASLTVNTDFAETEADVRQVNLTRFPLFFPEKRSFFLEGAGVFEIAGLGGRGDLLPFFSRRIGLLASREVPILLGAKLTGRQGAYNIGVLDVQTRRSEDLGLDPQNLLAARVSRNLFRQSWVGAVFTRGNPDGTGDNSLVGVDARFATSKFRGGKNLSLDLYLFRTDDRATRSVDYAGGFKLDYPNDLWDVALTWKQIGEDFRPALGFVPRGGIRRTTLGVSFMPRPERFGVRQLTFELRPDLLTNLDNRIDNWRVATVPLKLRTESGEEIECSFTPEFERLDAPFEIRDGVFIPAGSYRWTRYGAEVTTASKRRWVADFAWAHGGFYGGTRRTLEVGLKLKPSTHLAVEIDAERNDVRLPEGSFFTQVFELRPQYNFSPNVSWSNLIQYDNESRVLGFQSRFRWIITPGSDLFLVWNRGWLRTFERDFESSFDRATVKLQYTFRF